MPLADQGDEVAHPLFIDGLSPGGNGQQPLQGPHGLINHLFIAGHLQVCAPVDDADRKGILDPAYVFVKGTENSDQVLYPFGVYDSFRFLTHAYLLSAPTGCG